METQHFERGMSAAQYREQQRRRLERFNLLDRGWAVLGAAPDPTIPDDLLKSHCRVDINDAGRIAESKGYARAGLTVRSDRKPWKDHLETDTDALFIFKKRRVMFPRTLLFGKPFRHVGKVWTLQSRDVRQIVKDTSGVSLEGVGDSEKVSSTISICCYGLFIGVPEIVIMGVSLTRQGYDYESEKGKRRHVAEDETVLRALAKTGKVLTTEPEVADITELPLWVSSRHSR